jgi:predicted ATPase
MNSTSRGCLAEALAPLAGAVASLDRVVATRSADYDGLLWQLRAAVNLARVRGDQGCHAEARDLLAPVYGWFTEGFDTRDLQEAKALLDGLA